jgi:DNA-binding protein YbaB
MAVQEWRTAPFDEQVRWLQDSVDAVTGQLDELEVDGQDAEGRVTATVSGSGALRGLSLDPDRYCAADSEALGRAVIDAIAAAREQAARVAQELCRDLLPVEAVDDTATPAWFGEFLTPTGVAR